MWKQVNPNFLTDFRFLAFMWHHLDTIYSQRLWTRTNLICIAWWHFGCWHKTYAWSVSSICWQVFLHLTQAFCRILLCPWNMCNLVTRGWKIHCKQNGIFLVTVLGEQVLQNNQSLRNFYLTVGMWSSCFIANMKHFFVLRGGYWWIIWICTTASCQIPCKSDIRLCP